MDVQTNIRTIVTEQPTKLAQSVMLLTYIREVFGWDPDYTDEVFHLIPQSLEANSCILPQNSPRQIQNPFQFIILNIVACRPITR
jgi:hypothetical protein